MELPPFTLKNVAEKGGEILNRALSQEYLQLVSDSPSLNGIEVTAANASIDHRHGGVAIEVQKDWGKGFVLDSYVLLKRNMVFSVASARALQVPTQTILDSEVPSSIFLDRVTTWEGLQKLLARVIVWKTCRGSVTENAVWVNDHPDH